MFFAQKDSSTVSNVLYCLGFNYVQPDCDYDQDHIHPAYRFGSARPLSMTNEEWATARDNYNKLANLQLLESSQNRSKGNMDFNAYYASLSITEREKIKKEGFIPEPPAGMSMNDYYSIGNFNNFYNDRKMLLSSKIADLLNGKF